MIWTDDYKNRFAIPKVTIKSGQGVAVHHTYCNYNHQGIADGMIATAEPD